MLGPRLPRRRGIQDRYRSSIDRYRPSIFLTPNSQQPHSTTMHILKLPWFGHRAENRPVECYSVSVNTEGTRLASGGLDGNVKIWDIDTINQFKSVQEIDHSNWDDRLLPPKSHRRPMCSMSRHNGVVTSVKFSPDGRFLASGSDDKIVLIWEKDESMTNRPKPFGETEADLEHWTVRKRLVAHDNDIQDIGWSPDGSLLVTVGLDRLIMIWSGTTFERIKRYDIHQSMVKGVVFDPANKFFATASDDRTVRIFRYSKKLHQLVNDYEFQMEHVVFDPFKKSPLTSYFRRMSWSPDGQNIAVPNATNGPVPSVAIIKRGNWVSDISLIGHEAPCEVCSFCPRLFSITKDGDLFSILATAGQDRTLCIWSTFKSKPLVVAEDIASNSITDLCWNQAGDSLYMSCLDGTITCISFEPGELGEAITVDQANAQLHKYGTDRESNIFAESVEQLILEHKAKDIVKEGGPVNATATAPTTTTTTTTAPAPAPAPATTAPPPPKHIPSKITMKNGKKRVAPVLLSSSSAPSIPSSAPPTENINKKLKSNNKLSTPSYIVPRSGIATAIRGSKRRAQESTTNKSLVDNEDQDNDNEDMAIDLPESGHSNPSLSTLRKHKNKIKRQIMEARYPRQFKLISNLSESLFNHSSCIEYEIGDILNLNDVDNASDLFSSTSASADTNDEDLLFAVIVAGVYHKLDNNYAMDSNNNNSNNTVRSTIEVRNGPNWKEDEDELELDITYNDNGDFQDPTSVIVTNSEDHENRKYVMFFPFKIQHALPVVIKGVLHFYVLASFGGSVQIIYAESGSLVTPIIALGQNLIHIKQAGCYLMAITSNGLIYVWKLPIGKERGLMAIIKGISMASIMNHGVVVESNPQSLDNNKKMAPTPKIITPNVTSIEVSPENGSPFVMMSHSHDVYMYNQDLLTWVKVIDSWYYCVESNDKEPDNSWLKYFYHLSRTKFEEGVKRKRIGKYIFEKENDLKREMELRYVEMIREV